MIGAAGIYILNLVGYDYDDADDSLKKSIANLLNKHSEYRICQIAEEYVDSVPEVGLPDLLEHLDNKDFPVVPMEEADVEYY